MKILHTSDWHLGRRLLGKTRYEEFSQWLDYLLNKINTEHVDILIVAGDIFDTTTPSTKSQQLYYDFLNRLRDTPCRHTIIVGGNHDSAPLLDAPKALLSHMDIHVVGRMTHPEQDEIIILKDAQGKPELVVCAVPYLHERDIRLSLAGESIESKDRQIVQGIHRHYDQLAKAGAELAQQYHVPLVATGHLFMTGGQTHEDDGVRELYVGNEAALRADIFSEKYDYIALGHLHIPQKVAGKESIRYCGSPIPMGFGEANQNKVLLYVEFDEQHRPQVSEEIIPVFQRLERLKGNYAELIQSLDRLIESDESIWVDVNYTGQEVEPELKQKLEKHVAKSQVEILKVRNQRIMNQVLNSAVDYESLEDLDHFDVFERLLQQHNIQTEERSALKESYQQAIHTLQEEGKLI